MYGKRLRELRETVGKSQKEFAAELGIPQTTYSNWEREIAQPKFELLERLANLYNVDIGWLMGAKTDYHTMLENQYDDFADLTQMGFSTDEAYRMEQELFNRYGDMMMRLNYENRQTIINQINKLLEQQEKE